MYTGTQIVIINLLVNRIQIASCHSCVWVSEPKGIFPTSSYDMYIYIYIDICIYSSRRERKYRRRANFEYVCMCVYDKTKLDNSLGLRNPKARVT